MTDNVDWSAVAQFFNETALWDVPLEVTILNKKTGDSMTVQAPVGSTFMAHVPTYDAVVRKADAPQYVLVPTNFRIEHVGRVYGPFDSRGDAEKALIALNFPTPAEVYIVPISAYPEKG